MGLSSIPEAIQDIRAGKFVIIVDDENRENEGDLAIAAEKVSAKAINFMTLHGRGLVCMPVAGARLDELDIPLMVRHNNSAQSTAFTVSVDARHNITTGISAADRARTIWTMISPETRPDDLVSPGHIFPLRARERGVLEREGHTEAIVDLAKLAGLFPAGVLCEVLNRDGTMARQPQLRNLARRHGIKIVSIAHLIEYRLYHEVPARYPEVASPALVPAG